MDVTKGKLLVSLESANRLHTECMMVHKLVKWPCSYKTVKYQLHIHTQNSLNQKSIDSFLIGWIFFQYSYKNCTNFLSDQIKITLNMYISNLLSGTCTSLTCPLVHVHL